MNEQEYLARLFVLQQMRPYELLQELLSIIHDDGGSLVANFGPARAALEAEIKWHAMVEATTFVQAHLESRDAATPDSLSGG